VGSELAGNRDGDGVGDEVGLWVVGSEVVGSELGGSDVAGAMDGDGVGDGVGFGGGGSGLVGSELVGSEVVGSEVVGSDVAGATDGDGVGDGVGLGVVGSEVVGSEVVGADVAGAKDGDGVGDGVGFRVVGSEVVGSEVVGSELVGAEVVGAEVAGAGVVGSSMLMDVTGQVAPPAVTDSGSTSSWRKSCVVRSKKRTVMCSVENPKLAGMQSSLWRRERLPRRNPPKNSPPGQSSISILVLSSVIALPCEAVSVSRTASIRADWSASLPIASALSSWQTVSMIKVGNSSSSDVVLRQQDAAHTNSPRASVQFATAQSLISNAAARSS